MRNAHTELEWRFLCWNEARDSFRGRVIDAGECFVHQEWASGLERPSRDGRSVWRETARGTRTTDKLARCERPRSSVATHLANHPPEPLDMAEPAINPEREDGL